MCLFLGFIASPALTGLRLLLFFLICVSCFLQVIAIVMDMFTDVDVLHDVLTAAMRNVAVYILLDEQNVHHFVNMVSNCRVNLQAFPVSEGFIPLRAFKHSSFF